MTDKSPAMVLDDVSAGRSTSIDRSAPDEMADAELSLDPELVEALYNLLTSVDPGSPALDSGLRKLRIKYHDAVYTELLYLLSHLRFEPGEAKQHWERIVAHRVSMEEREGAPVDMRVALVSYFVQVNRKLKNPKIIEMRLFERTRASAYRDELTGLYNYRLFREYLAHEILKSVKYSTPLSLVMADVDNFKTYNDKNGHEAGSDTLATIARLLEKSLRKTDLPARYGGEEFALILPSTPKISAQMVAEQARERIEQHAFDHEETQPGGKLTISMGIATFPADAEDAAELVRHADRAMYMAKANGKNQVELYGQSRRSYDRIETVLRGTFRALETDVRALTTLNVSEAGMLFLTDGALPVGALLETTLQLPDSHREIHAVGRVVHVEDHFSGQHQTAIQVIEMSEDDRAHLISHTRQLTPTH